MGYDVVHRADLEWEERPGHEGQEPLSTRDTIELLLGRLISVAVATRRASIPTRQYPRDGCEVLRKTAPDMARAPPPSVPHIVRADPSRET